MPSILSETMEPSDFSDRENDDDDDGNDIIGEDYLEDEDDSDLLKIVFTEYGDHLAKKYHFVIRMVNKTAFLKSVIFFYIE